MYGLKPVPFKKASSHADTKARTCCQSFTACWVGFGRGASMQTPANAPEPLRMSRQKVENRVLSRRSLLKTLGLTPLILRSAPLHGFLPGFPGTSVSGFPLSDIRLIPHYPARSPLEDVLRLVAPGSDEYVTEKYAFEIGGLLQQWSRTLEASATDFSALAELVSSSIEASPLVPESELTLRSGNGLECKKRRFGGRVVAGRERFLEQIRTWLGPAARVETAEFEITRIEEVASTPLTVRLDIRYDLVFERGDKRREERVGL